MIFASYMDKETEPARGSYNHHRPGYVRSPLMSGFIIIPPAFAYGIQPDAGPSLIFLTIPNPVHPDARRPDLGKPVLHLPVLRRPCPRSSPSWKASSPASGNCSTGSGPRLPGLYLFLIAVGSIPCVLGFNVWSGFQPLGPGTGVLDLEDFIVSNNLLPLGGLTFVLFCTRKNGWGWNNFLAEVNVYQGRNLPGFWKSYLTYGLPPASAGCVSQRLRGYVHQTGSRHPGPLAGHCGSVPGMDLVLCERGKGGV